MDLPRFEVVDQARLARLRLRVETNDKNFRGMKKLKMRGMDLIRLPRELFVLHELQVLDLSPERETCLHNRLAEVPSQIGRLTNLQILMLDTNELAEIPEEIADLSSLQRLSLSNNHIQTLPASFSRLQNLTSLHMTNNKVTEFPALICELTNLEFLDLCDNEISRIPDEISQLTNLRSLLLFLNVLTELPDTICQITTLRCLWVGRNKLEKLPREFGRLEELDWGRVHTVSSALDGNPLRDPPINVCKRGPGAIAAYFSRSRTSRDATDAADASKVKVKEGQTEKRPIGASGRH